MEANEQTKMAGNKMRSKLFRLLKKYQQWVFGEYGIIITLFVTLVGFLISIGNDYFSQFNYNHTDIWNDFCTSNHIAKFEEIVETQTYVPKHYFILDVSGSISERAKMQDMTDDIWNRIKKIKSSGFATTEGFNFGVNDKSEKIEYRRLLQIHLMYSLRKLYEKKQNKVEVILFSENPRILPCNNMQEIFDSIYNLNFKGVQSDFITLFRCVDENVLSDIGTANIFKRRECHLIIFSDYEHDTKKNDSVQLYNAIKDFTSKIEEKNIDIKIHYLEGVAHTKNKSFLDLLFSESSSSKVEKLDVDYGIISSLVSKKPIPFHYARSSYEEELTSTIQFNFPNKKDLSIGLDIPAADFNGMKQEYYVIQNKDTIHLSNKLKTIEVDTAENVILMIKGYIPAPYKSPDIIIEDKEKGVRHIIPVFFYRNFPYTCYWLLALIILISLASIIAFIIYFISRKSTSFNEPSLEKENKQPQQTLNNNEEDMVCCKDNADKSVVNIKEHNRIISEKEREKREISNKLSDCENEVYLLKNKLSKTEYDKQQLEEELSQYKEKQ